MDDLIKLDKTSDNDFKLEVVITSLIEQGCDPELIQILRDGIDRRGISKDIEQVYQKFNDDDLKPYTHIHVNREGIYDILPEGVFHKSTYKRSYKDAQTDVEKALDEIKIHREQEFFARRFFQLFEQVIDNTLTDIYQNEIKYDRIISNREFTDLFIQYWPVLKRLKHHQAVAFMYVIPLLSKIRLKGRVKRLAHTIQRSDGVIALLPEMIIKQTVRYYFNRFLQEKVYCLACKVCWDAINWIKDLKRETIDISKKSGFDDNKPGNYINIVAKNV